MSIRHGRGSEAKGIHFYQTIQLRQLQDQELVTTLTHFLFSFHSFFSIFLCIIITKQVPFFQYL
jgi:hypothetical protein